MAQYLRTWSFWWDLFRDKFLHTNVKRGNISIGHGDHEITIPIHEKIRRVSLSVEEPPGSMPVCMGDINLVGAKVSHKGFVLYARIRTNTAIVGWIVETDEPIDDDFHREGHHEGHGK